MSTFDRYASFKSNGKIDIVPFIAIRSKSSDKFVKFDKRSMRLDKLSYDYYGDSDYAWLIMQANPQYGSIENFITDGSVLRIPFPLDDTLNTYLNDIIAYKELHNE